MQADPVRIRRAFAEGRAAGRRHRDLAEGMGIPEAMLLEVHAGLERLGHDDAPLQAIRLRPDWVDALRALEPCNEVMALTRNGSCVHEKVGVYRKVSASSPVGLVLAGDIDLRLFYRHWAVGYAVLERTARGPQRSLQFFDAHGEAVHKVFARPATDLDAWQALVMRCADPAVQPFRPAPVARRPAEVDDAAVDVHALHAGWRGLRDTHAFFDLLRSVGTSRTQALRLAEREFAHPADPAAAERLLRGAAVAGVPIMVFVGNPGTIQIHTGPVRRVETAGPWVNVMDPGFNLHLRADRIAQAWVVRKPTDDGLVTSLELFDAAGDTIAMVFGERKPGRPELPAWRALLEGAVDAPVLS